MPLTPGTRLGPYELVAPLGAGGMGEVHRARDTRLGRDVAIKALPAAFAQDPERLARFEREAKLLASLNHPNVAGIHGIEDVDGARYLVLEFVDGETLEAALRGGPLPLADVLDVARQVAAGVEAAHEAGVVHRDLKPGNVMLTGGGVVKVLDFGLAKGGGGQRSASSDPRLSASPTMTYHGTEAGMILGTAAYMSPEQARGKAVDRRTDIWSFGCVLFEMLTGRRAYDGETVSDMVARILERDPEWSALPAGTPPRLVALLRRCLTKDAKLRQRDIGDVKLELDAIAAGDEGQAPASPRVARANALPWAIAALAVAAAVVAAFVAMKPRAASPAVEAYLLPPVGHHFALGLQVPQPLALSHDGRFVVYSAFEGEGRARLFLRELGSETARAIPGTEDGRGPCFSFDDHAIAFFANGKLKRVDLAGGSPAVLADAPDGRGVTWGRDDVLLFSGDSYGPLMRVLATGGPVTHATELDTTANEDTHRFPHFLPDGRHYLFLARSGSAGKGRKPMLYAQALGSTKRVPVLEVASSMAYSDGHLLFVRDGVLFAQPFDPRSLRVSGRALAVVSGVNWEERYSRGSWAASPNGVLVAFLGSNELRTRLEWFDRSGRSLGTLGELEQYTYGGQPQISPDGRSVLMTILDTVTGASNAWYLDVATGRKRRVTMDDGDHPGACWMPDGREIVVNGGWNGLRKSGFLVQSLDGVPGAVFTSPRGVLWPLSVTPDGRTLIYSNTADDPGLYASQRGGPDSTVRLVTGRVNSAHLCSDGRWLAYSQDHDGRSEVYVTTWPMSGAKWQVSSDGGDFPRWGGDGRELFYADADNRIIAVQVRTGAGGGFEMGTVTPLFQKRPPMSIPWFDPGPDPNRLLLSTQPPDSTETPILLLSRWTTRLTHK
ncbi:MAG: protein kinase [Candidatus Eisenbacteria bacterium]